MGADALRGNERRSVVKALFECDMENERLAEKGIEFICPNHHCPLRILCPYAKRTSYNEVGARDGSEVEE